jgi:hypothetical protein
MARNPPPSPQRSGQSSPLGPILQRTHLPTMPSSPLHLQASKPRSRSLAGLFRTFRPKPGSEFPQVICSSCSREPREIFTLQTCPYLSGVSVLKTNANSNIFRSTKSVPQAIQTAVAGEQSALDSAAAKIIGTPTSTSKGAGARATGLGVAGVVGVVGGVLAAL